MWWSKLLIFVIGISSAEEHTYGVTCGKLPQVSRVVNGQNADMNKIGYQVYFKVVFKNAQEATCGGSIIGKKHILTAAHCTTANLSLIHSRVITGSEKIIEGGDFFPKGTHYKIAKVFDHPKYNNDIHPPAADISILELTTEIKFSQKVFPICLPSSDFCLKKGKKLQLSGWGADVNNKDPNHLQEALVELLDFCIHGEHEERTVLCAGATLVNGKLTNLCQGDSGGPLAYFDATRVATLYGINSNVVFCNKLGDPGIYVRVSEYVDWIKKVSGVYMKGEKCVSKKLCADKIDRLGWTNGGSQTCTGTSKPTTKPVVSTTTSTQKPIKPTQKPTVSTTSTQKPAKPTQKPTVSTTTTTKKPIESSPVKPCENSQKIIRDDNTIRPKTNTSMCAMASQNKKGQVKTGAKFVWGDCKNAVLKSFVYQADTKLIGSVKTKEIQKGKNRQHCWSVNRKTLKATTKNLSATLRLKACKASDVRQHFKLEGGQIWLDMKFDDGKKYCVRFEGKVGSVRVRQCWESLV